MFLVHKISINQYNTLIPIAIANSRTWTLFQRNNGMNAQINIQNTCITVHQIKALIILFIEKHTSGYIDTDIRKPIEIIKQYIDSPDIPIYDKYTSKYIENTIVHNNTTSCYILKTYNKYDMLKIREQNIYNRTTTKNYVPIYATVLKHFGSRTKGKESELTNNIFPPPQAGRNKQFPWRAPPARNFIKQFPGETSPVGTHTNKKTNQNSKKNFITKPGGRRVPPCGNAGEPRFVSNLRTLSPPIQVPEIRENRKRNTKR